MLRLASQVTPPAVSRRTPQTSVTSVAVPPKVGVNAPGKRSWKEKQFSSASTRASGSGSGTLSHHPDHRASGRTRAVRRQHVADEQRAPAIGAEDAASGVRVAEEEAAARRSARITRVPVELEATLEEVAEVAEQLQVAVHIR